MNQNFTANLTNATEEVLQKSTALAMTHSCLIVHKNKIFIRMARKLTGLKTVIVFTAMIFFLFKLIISI